MGDSFNGRIHITNQSGFDCRNTTVITLSTLLRLVIVCYKIPQASKKVKMIVLPTCRQVTAGVIAALGILIRVWHTHSSTH